MEFIDVAEQNTVEGIKRETEAANQKLDEISDGVGGVGDTVAEINEKVGTGADSGSSSGKSLFSLIKYLTSMFASHWTTTRAEKIDNLDAPILSRASQSSVDAVNAAVGALAPADKALSKEVWTDDRAQKLDNLDMKMSSLSSVGTGLGTANDGIEDVTDKLGKSSDSASSSGTTVFGLLKYLAGVVASSWTSTRADKLDDLDAPVSSRASQESVDILAEEVRSKQGDSDVSVSIGTNTDGASATGKTTFALLKYLIDRFAGFWTDARAEKIEHLDAPVSGRASQSTADNIDSLVTALHNGFNGRGGYVDQYVSTRAAQSTADAIYNLVNSRIGTIDATYNKVNAGVTAIAPRTKPFFTTVTSGTSNTTLLSINGAGYLTGIMSSSSDVYNIIVDGVTVDGFKTATNTSVTPLRVRFRSSLVVHLATSSGTGTRSIYGSVEF